MLTKKWLGHNEVICDPEVQDHELHSGAHSRHSSHHNRMSIRDTYSASQAISYLEVMTGRLVTIHTTRLWLRGFTLRPTAVMLEGASGTASTPHG